MRKLIIFGLLAIISPVKSTNIIKTHVLEEGDPFTYVGDKPSAAWYVPGKVFVKCENCPSSPCTVHEDYKDKIDASCDETHPVIHVNSIPVDADYSYIASPVYNIDFTLVRVGRYDGRLHSENNSPVAVKRNSFTLVCDRGQDGGYYWFTDEYSGTRFDFHTGCIEGLSHYDGRRFEFTCDERSSKLRIKKVTSSDDGKLFGCSELFGVPSLFRLTVKCKYV